MTYIEQVGIGSGPGEDPTIVNDLYRAAGNRVRARRGSDYRRIVNDLYRAAGNRVRARQGSDYSE